jgi:hypothetical protein
MKLWKKLIVAVETPDAPLPKALITATQKNAATISAIPHNNCRVIVASCVLYGRVILSGAKNLADCVALSAGCHWASCQ